MLDFVVFFFKQKTAYEMRISDWSSDVCSSDLAAARDRAAAATRADGRRCRSDVPHAVGFLADDVVVAGAVRQHRGSARLFRAAPRHGKIGRASCRERVCQYV